MNFRSATKSKTCPECQAKLTDSSPIGPCPACLMQLGIRTWRENQASYQLDPTIEMSAGNQGAIPPEELAEKFSQYQILHLVGHGGMGTVYCARQKSLNRLVALKVIRPNKNQRAEFADRFVREARAMAQLNHPNIVTVHDFGQIDDLYFFVMEYVDGINLRQMIRGNQLTSKQALEIVPAVCDALQYAHDKGIVHRDIKPENILVDTDGNIKIADFGLAKLLDKETAGPQLTQANHIMGTMHYMAPEQIEKPLTVDHRADIYSLGVVIYELLTGELPLGRFAPPSHKVTVDVRMDEIVLHTLAKEPSLRYQRVSEVKSDMQSISHRLAPESAIPVAPGGELPGGVGKPAVASWQPNPRFVGPVPKTGFIASVFQPQSYRNMLYLLLSFPLGIIYFVLLITGFATGIGTLIVWIGIPILLGTLLAARGCMALERNLTRMILRSDVPVTRYRQPDQNKTVFERAKGMVTSGNTWKGVFYLFSKFPMGIVSFVLLTTLIAIPLGLISSPILWNVFGVPHEMFDSEIDSNLEATAAFIVGCICLPFSIWAINGVAWLNARWSAYCLRRI